MCLAKLENTRIKREEPRYFQCDETWHNDCPNLKSGRIDRFDPHFLLKSLNPSPLQRPYHPFTLYNSIKFKTIMLSRQ